MWSLPGPGMELVSPALAGTFLSTVPQGKSEAIHFLGLCSFTVIIGTGSHRRTPTGAPELYSPTLIKAVLWPFSDQSILSLSRFWFLAYWFPDSLTLWFKKTLSISLGKSAPHFGIRISNPTEPKVSWMRSINFPSESLECWGLGLLTYMKLLPM